MNFYIVVSAGQGRFRLANVWSLLPDSLSSIFIVDCLIVSKGERSLNASSYVTDSSYSHYYSFTQLLCLLPG